MIAKIRTEDGFIAEAFEFDFLAHQDGRLELVLHLDDPENGRQVVVWREQFPTQDSALDEARRRGLMMGQLLASGCWALGPASE